MKATFIILSFFAATFVNAEVSRYEPASLDKKGIAAAYRVQMNDWSNHKLPLLRHIQASLKWHKDNNKLPTPENRVEGDEQHMAWILQNRRYGNETEENSKKVIVPRTDKGQIDESKWQYSQLSAIVDENDNLIGIRLRTMNYNNSGTIKVRDFSSDQIVTDWSRDELTSLIYEERSFTVVTKGLRIMRLGLPDGFAGDAGSKRLSKTEEQKIRLVYLHQGAFRDSSDVFGNADFSIKFIPNDDKKPDGEGQWVLLKAPGTELHLVRGGARTVNLEAGKHPLDTRLVEAIITDLKYKKSYGIFGGFDDWEEQGIENLLPVSVLGDKDLAQFIEGKKEGKVAKGGL